MNKPEASPLWVLAGIIFLIAWIPAEGWMVSQLWGMFIVPLGAPSITWQTGAGISILVSWMTLKVTMARDDIGIGMIIGRHIGAFCVTYGMALFINWLQ